MLATSVVAQPGRGNTPPVSKELLVKVDSLFQLLKHIGVHSAYHNSDGPKGREAVPVSPSSNCEVGALTPAL